VLATPDWAAAELAALPVRLPNAELPIEDTVLLTWLGHVAAGLARATRNSLSPMWLVRNVRPVAQRFVTPGNSRLASGAA
jgi:hypothetical protein